MPKQVLSIPALMKLLTSEAAAYELLEDLRWRGEPVCPHCGTIDRATYIQPVNGTSRATRTGRPSERRVWKCNACRKQFTVLVGTIFHGTKISIRTWVLVLLEMCASKNGISAREIERKYDLTAKSAWFMAHRIREAMKTDPLAGLMRGTIIADETWVGGDPANRHGDGPGYGRTDKQPVMALIDYETREVRSRVIPDVTGRTLATVLRDEVEVKRSQLWTDESSSYRSIGEEFNSHHKVNHNAGEYKRDGAGTNLAEGYFSQLKRSIDGTHHHVSVEHLGRYLAHFDFLYTHCRASDSERMIGLLQRVGGRRLTYKPLTASVAG
ncbi:MAG: hypothetical protein QOD07_2432 [Frankiaceae bacterium]|jgi:transposase-like protein|nr:hypothetical protein [Frankiaceae bacterium]